MRLAPALAFLFAIGCAPIPGIGGAPACAENWAAARGRTPITVSPGAPIVVEPGQALLVRGVVSGDTPAPLVLRVDDGRSSNYASRVNVEQMLPPGPFVWHYPLAGAKTSGGRVLDARDIRRLMLFEPERAGRVQVEAFGLEAVPRLPADSVGFSLGAPDAPLIGGLTRLTPDDPRISARHAVAVRRPSPDPVVANGIAGIERLHFDWPRGRAHVSMWLEDVGEWETLPYVLQHRVRVNGRDLLSVNPSPQQWITGRYLAGRDREASANDDAWTAFGRFRGGLVSGDVDVGDDGVTIELAGTGAPANFLSAVVIEPAGRSLALDAVQAARRQWMVENFPVVEGVKAEPVPVFGTDAASAPNPLRATVAPGSGARLAFAAGGSGLRGRPTLSIAAPALEGSAVALRLYAAQWRLDRTGANSTLLRRDDRLLRGDPASLPILPGEPRRYLAWASAPKDAKPGVYRGAVRLAAVGRVTVPIEVEVLPVKLPEPASPAGFYLDEAPHLTWFDGAGGDRGRQLGCDLSTLARFGVLGDAPGLATPDARGRAAFLQDTRRADSMGVASPWLAYTPLKRLIATLGTDAAAKQIKTALADLEAAKLPAPVWALFDEPANLGGGESGAAATAAKLRAAAPNIRLGGQFNNPGDRRYLDTVDVAIVNPGYGIDAGTIDALKAAGREVWLYNTGATRFTAGLWLWRTGASRYIQWHARMPTADPYDPTDGREGDVQAFPPMPEVCAANQDIDVALIAMAEGLVDQRWLQWLASRPEPKAKTLRAEILRGTPDDWASASKGGADRAAAVRESILTFARTLE